MKELNIDPAFWEVKYGSSYPTDEGKPLLIGCLLIPVAGIPEARNHLCHPYEIDSDKNH